MKLEVIKDCYYITEDSLQECTYLSKEELFDSLAHLLVVGDIWETDKEYPEYLVCVSGEWEGELSDGWWEYEKLKDYFKEI
jgi:hypothetical protein